MAVQNLMSTSQRTSARMGVCPLLFLKHLANHAGSAAVDAQAATKAAAEAGLLHGGAPDARRALQREATHTHTGRERGALHRE